MSGLLRLLKVAITRGRVTFRYPKEKTPVPEGIRGKPEIDFEACVGCGGCVSTCPPNALTMEDNNNVRTIRLFYGRCIFCGRCEEACPVGAITLTDVFELASLGTVRLDTVAEYKLAKCESCGAYHATEKCLKDVLSAYDEALTDYEEELRKMILLCLECRRKRWSERLAETHKGGLKYG